MRQFSTATVQELFAAETEQAWLWLLFIYSPELPDGVVRLVNNMTGVLSRGMQFTAFPFSVVLPTDSEEHQPQLQIVIDNVEMLLVDMLRSMTTPPTCTLELIALTRKDAPELTVTDLVLRNTGWDAQKVTFDLSHEDVMHARFPAGTYNPEEFAGLF